jgi:predicted RNase H-related nuclease YkuK (DUF458 family)
MEWLDNTGKRFTNEEVLKKIVTALNDGQNEHQIIVGTDSNANGRQYKFVTVLAIYKVGKGGDYYYLASHEPRATFRGGNHKMRLFQEVAKSIEVADMIRDVSGITVTEIHVDASPSDLNDFSSEFSDQLKGYVIASGYNVKIKPMSWVANCVADKHSK